MALLLALLGLAVPARAVSLRTVSAFGGTDASALAYVELLREYEAQTGNVVEDSSGTSDESWKACVLNDFAAGNEPDILFFFACSADSAPILRKMVPISEINAAYPGLNLPESGILREADGAVYAIPLRPYFEGLFVNTDLFDRYGAPLPDLSEADFVVTHAYRTDLAVEDADSDVLFPSERLPMDMTEYTQKKQLCIRSAQDFEKLFASVPQKDRSLRKSRRTFYGRIPCSAREMAEHTNRMLAEYANAIGVPFENEGGLLENRKRLFRAIESRPDFLSARVCTDADGELWTLKKLMRRILWHDRIHARALYRLAVSFWGKDRIGNPFFFSTEK
jgi:hypothetical protein